MTDGGVRGTACFSSSGLVRSGHLGALGDNRTDSARHHARVNSGVLEAGLLM